MVYTSEYIKNKYNLSLSKDFGEILECIALEDFRNNFNNFNNYISVEKLGEYFDRNFIKSDRKSLLLGLLIMMEEETREYFFARYMINIIKESYGVSAEQPDLLMNYIEENCNKRQITDRSMRFLKEFIEGKKDSIYSYRIYTSALLNRKIEENYFRGLEERDRMYIFLNLWKIVKLFGVNEDPIYNKNRQEFSDILKLISITNEKLNISELKGLNLSFMNFSKIDLSDTRFFHVNFSNSNFEYANLDAIQWSESDLSNSNFESAFMECAWLDGCNCKKASFKKANLLSSVVSGADFSYANFENTNFMECDADRIHVKGLKINDKTAFNDSDFRYVDWQDVDISGISISEDQVSHFWEVVNYTRNTILFDAKFNKLENNEIQNVIYKELKASSESYLKTTKLNYVVNDIFISYASEEKQQYVFPMYHRIRKIKENDMEKYSVWIDDDHLTIGEKLRQSIESVISYCKLVIIFFSDNYAKKGWTRYELYRIIEEQKKRDLNVIIIDMSSETEDLLLFQDIRTECSKDNYYKSDVDNEYMGKVIKRIMELI